MRAVPLALLLLPLVVRAEEVSGTLLERGGEPNLAGRALVADDPALQARLRQWIGRDVTLRVEAGPDRRLRVQAVVAPREVQLSGWVASDHERPGMLLWCSEAEVWRTFGPARDELRRSRGRWVTARGFAFALQGAPDALCVEALEAGEPRAEPARARGVLGWDDRARGPVLRPPEGPAWRLLRESARSPVPWLLRLCGCTVTLEGLALPAAEGAPRALLIERASTVETVVLPGLLEDGHLVSEREGRLALASPCTDHGGGDPAGLLARLRGRRVQLKGELVRDEQGKASQLVPTGAVAEDGAGRVVLVTGLDAAGKLTGTLAGQAVTWDFAALRFEPAAPPPKRIPGH